MIIMTRLKWLLLTLVLVVLTPEVLFAEGRCPSGMFETSSRDYIACAPLPGYGQGNNDSVNHSPPPIPTVWETRWGAIATEFNGGGFGAVTNLRSETACYTGCS